MLRFNVLLLLFLASTLFACLEKQVSQELASFHRKTNYLHLANQQVTIAGENIAANITTVELSDQEENLAPLKLDANKRLHDAAPLKFSKLVFSFTDAGTLYTCKLKDTELLRAIEFDKVVGCETSQPPFDKCLAHLEEHRNHTYTDGNHIVKKRYKYSENPNIQVFIGEYATSYRSIKALTGCKATDEPSCDTKDGDFEETVRIMNQNGISCKKGADENKLILTFANETRSDFKSKVVIYDEQKHKGVAIGIGPSDDGSKQLSITVKTNIKGKGAAYYIIDTDNNGNVTQMGEAEFREGKIVKTEKTEN